MSDTSNPTAEATPADHLYEIRTEDGTAYRADGELGRDNGWFTVRRTDGTLALQVPQHRVLAARLLDPAELEAEAALIDREHLVEQISEARMWARHGYEIGQRHCSWTDHGVAPDWLTDEWPPSFDSCEYLQKAAEFDEALARVRNLATQPEAMNAQQEHPGVWKHGYECGVLAAKSATQSRGEKTRKS